MATIVESCIEVNNQIWLLGNGLINNNIINMTRATMLRNPTVIKMIVVL